MKKAEEIFHNKLVHYNPEKFPNGMKKAFYRAMEEYAEQFKYDFSKKCGCGSDRIGETWCCNQCGLPVEKHSSEYASLKEDNILVEIERRQQIILSEPNGILRETMISNLLIDLPSPPKTENK